MWYVLKGVYLFMDFVVKIRWGVRGFVFCWVRMCIGIEGFYGIEIEIIFVELEIINVNVCDLLSCFLLNIVFIVIEENELIFWIY